MLDATRALDDGAPSLWDGRGNEAALLTKRFGDVEEAFARRRTSSAPSCAPAGTRACRWRRAGSSPTGTPAAAS